MTFLCLFTIACLVVALWFTVRQVALWRKAPCDHDCLSPCCHYGCENVRGHRW